MSTSKKPDKKPLEPPSAKEGGKAKDGARPNPPDRQDEPLDENSLERVMRDAPL
jgi:hypothetical protein